MSADSFNDHRLFRVLSPDLSAVISALNLGRSSKSGTVIVHASSKGYLIKIDGRTFARGSTPRELHADFKRQVDEACKVKI